MNKSRFLLSAALSFLPVAAAFLNAPSPAHADEIPVDRVVLSTSGLADFEMRAKVSGNAALQFPVRLNQVDDILKSLVVFDAKGRLGGVTLPGKQPLAEVFKDLPFTRAQLADQAMLLNAYQGAALSVKGAALTATGKIMQVVPEETELKGDKTITRHRLTLMTAEGMKQAVLEDLDSFQFVDAKPKEEIARALDAVRESGASDRRMLTVNLLGDGGREVLLSYVVDAPLWKAAYRMVVPEAGQDKGLLQGWAVIENMTAADWKDVDLTLVSGNPVTYRQALYQSYYVDRPEIPVQVFGRVMPRVDNGAVASAETAERDEETASNEMKEERAKDMPLRELKKTMSARTALAAMQKGGYAVGGMAPAAPEPSVMSSLDAVAQVANAAQSAEATTQVLFRFPDRFSLKSGQSMMLPFVSRSVPMSRVSLYQPETHPTHPLAAVELKNDGESGLPPGILTLYEESATLKGAAFVGDAQLPVLAAGEKRLVSYALDSKTDISRTQNSTSTEDKVSISQGVIRTSVVSRMETTYVIKAPAKEDRTVILEQPKMGDYKITQPDPKDVEVTDTHYRVRVPVKAGETKKVGVVLENQMWQSYAIGSFGTDQLEAYATTRGNLDPETRAAFKKLSEVRRALDALDQQINAFEQQRQRIFEDQARVRENLKSLDGKSDVKDKYLTKLNEQEDHIAEIDRQREKLNAARAEKLRELQEMIAGVKF
jgi:hypothetical protein